MTPDRWQQIEDVFHAALEVQPEERASVLSARTGDDDELRSEVEKLLSQFDEADSFISQPLLDSGNGAVLSSLLDDAYEDPMTGQILGSYRIEREIGRGGMGAVYEAVRADGEFRRRVAIKIVKRGVDTDFVLRRFRNERQILATLDHAYITRLIDGGTTDDGRPYFVMDYIDGLSLYRFADKHGLSINQRLRLFVRIGDAVQYAHERRVIHRDLKPSNILVTQDASPRLLDFGIAKLLDPELSFETLQPTATALRMMTVDYASPEQVRGEKVDFTTDVYSLGVVLYELLTGFRPYQVRSRAPYDVAKAICDEEPALPSEVAGGFVAGNPVPVSKSATTLLSESGIGDAHTDAVSELRGNLDNILMKALEKEPDKRYKTVAEFCADIECHLDGKAVDVPQYLPRKRSEPFSASAESTKLLAVLPLKFLNFTATENTDENYLSIGLADAIISRLTSVRDFTVRPTSSISGYEKSDTDPLQAGRELGVDFVLDGRIKKAGEKLRVSLQMLDVRMGSTTWAGQFDEKFNDVLALEDAISEQVAEALVSQITGEQNVKLGTRGTDNAEAYEAFIKGRFYWNQFTSDALPKAIEQFHMAVALDPNYALAHVGVADFYNWANIYGLLPPVEADRLARASVERAIEINDQLGEAYATLGLIEKNHFNWEACLALQEKALELNPNYQHTHEWVAAILVGDGNAAEGLRAMARAEELDPLSLRTKTLTAWTTYQAHDFTAALAKANEIIDLDAHYPQGHLQKGYILTEIGDPNEAVAEIEKGMALMPDSPLTAYYYCFALAAAGRMDEARQVLAELKNTPGYVKAMFVGLACVAVGDYDDAFTYFDQAVNEFDPWLVWFGTEPKLKVLHSDKRFLDLLRRTRNPIIKRFEPPSQPREKTSIAVLPLQILGTTTDAVDGEFLGVGLADAMITRLSQVRRILVRPTSSVMKHTTYDDPLAVGRELNVDFVLSGTLRRVGERMRISAQLLELENNSTVWAEKFDEKFSDVLDLEDIVSDKVARLLIPQLTGDEQQKLARRGTDKPEAYEVYLKGRAHWLRSTPEAFVQALLCYNEAIAIDPNFAAPYAGVADYHNFLSVFGIMPPRASFPAAKENAEKALALDPELAEAYVSLAITSYTYDWDFERCDQLFKKAIELSPNLVAAHMWYAHFLSLIGRGADAEFHIERANEIAPNTYSTLIIYAFILRNERRYAESRAKLSEAHRLQPDHYLAMQAYSWNVLGLKNFDESEAMCRRAVAADAGLNMSSYALALVLAASGKRVEALEITDKLIAFRETGYVPPVYMALIFSALDDKEKAFEWLEVAITERDCWVPWLAADPRFDVLRDDERYFGLLKRIGISTSDHQANVTDSPFVELLGRHKYKLAALTILLILLIIAYATGAISVSVTRSDIR